MIAAILDAVKLSSSYVPAGCYESRADPRHIFEDSQAGLIITNDENLRLAGTLTQKQCQQVNIDKLDCGMRAGNPNLTINPAAYAYVLYASGFKGA